MIFYFHLMEFYFHLMEFFVQERNVRMTIVIDLGKVSYGKRPNLAVFYLDAEKIYINCDSVNQPDRCLMNFIKK